MAKSMIAKPIEAVLDEHQSRVYEAKAILELVSDLLTQGLDGERDGARVMSAVDGAIRILEAVNNLGDAYGLAQEAGMTP